MRLTSRLCAQNIGFMFKKHWHVQGKRVARSTGAIEELLKHGITIKNPNDIAYPKSPYVELDIFKKTIIDTSSYIECYDFGNNSVFVEGLSQAQIISNAIVVDEFPEKICDSIRKSQIPSNINKNIHRSILASCALDAYQEKLPKVKVPGRPMYNLPRIYGIPSNRRCELLISKLLFECDKLVDGNISLKNKVVNDAYFEVFVQKDGDFIRLNVKADTLLLNKQSISPFKSSFEGTVPDLFPMKFTIGLPQVKLPMNELQPFRGVISKYWPQTIFSHFAPEEVTNVYGTPVTSHQFVGRTLLKAFAAAYSKAKSLYGSEKQNLEKPIVVQGIHTDGKQFHFGIFQLNSMDLSESNETKNIWFQTPILHMFESCKYEKGKPILDGYNPEVFKIFNVFYKNS